MKKEKLVSVMIAALLMLSTLTLAYIPVVKSGEFSVTNKFKGTIKPQVVSGAYPYPTQEFTFNITFLEDTASVKIKWPSGWTFVSAYSENKTIIWDKVTSTASDVTFSNSTSATTGTNVWDIFHVTVVAATSGYATKTWTVETFDSIGASLGSDDVDVTITPWFDAKITPTLVRKGQSQWFEITVKNNASEASIYQVDITYPSTDGWAFQDVIAPTGWIIQSHTAPTIVFKATGGYEIAKGSSKIFKIKMLTGGVASHTYDYTWTVDAKNTADAIATMDATVKSDNTPPTITINAPTVSWYSVGAGNYMWLNITVSDDVNKLPSVVLNDTRFTLHASPLVSGAYNFLFCYRNNTAIPDGPLAIQINVTDYIGNPATIYPKIVSTTVDNTPPFIWITVDPATPVGSTFWIGKTQATVTINVTVADYELEPIGPFTGIYINGTLQTGWTFTTTSKTYKGYTVFECVKTGYSVPTNKNYWIIYVNVTDKTRPKNHTSQMTVYIKRDLVPPYEIGFTSVKPICGGLIIYGLYAKDTVGIEDYRVYLNGTLIAEVDHTDLISTTWVSRTGYGALAHNLVLDLTGYIGYVTINISARDYGLNEGSQITVYAGIIPDGEWYPIVLYEGWNLISLPLVPYSTAASDILSLILKQGAAGVEVYYGFDNEAKKWIMNPATMTDGNGYWLSVKAYDVLIVQGTPHEEYWGLQPIYYLLYKGWNLAGYTETVLGRADWYVSSLQDGTYFRYLFVWNAQFQRWTMVDTDGTRPGDLSPGQGFWMLLYEDQTLVPPVP